MNLTVNGEQLAVGGEQCSVVTLLSSWFTGLRGRCNDTYAGIAVAINGEVVARTQWEHFSVTEHDEVLIITATQGG